MNDVVMPPPAPALLTVGIGASAGGLEACSHLLNGLGDGAGVAFVLIQHLDPTHTSLMAPLLASHTSMTVLEATDGMPLEAAHLYVIPPGRFLALRDGALRLSRPRASHGTRMAFDFLLRSLAEECGPRAVCVILSGTGEDGTAGARLIRQGGGLVIAQDPAEAAFGGMPQAAIAAGWVDLILPVSEMAAAIAARRQQPGGAGTGLTPAAEADRAELPHLAAIIDLLRVRTAHDFTLYKEGTLARRIERRMAMLPMTHGDTLRYLDRLQADPVELDLLAKDLLINVTSFFRDPKVFAHLARVIVPELVRGQPHGQALRIWVAGCSTGEETYSLAMLFREEIAAGGSHVKLQLFASDADPDAVARARDGLYPASIAADVSPERLARFFVREGDAWRVSPELRGIVVFAVQDILVDPPFSRIDLVSCRNLLIYLRPEAQARVLALFHFALRDGGVLLLGNSETIPAGDGRFKVIDKAERLYRHVGRSRPGELALLIGGEDGRRAPSRQSHIARPSRQVVLAELCRRTVMEAYTPAAVIINPQFECLHSLGPIDRYLRVASGAPTHDLLAMTPPDLRIRLRAAIERAQQDPGLVVISANAGGRHGEPGFSIHVHRLLHDGETLLLLCFVDAARDAGPTRAPAGADPPPANLAGVHALEQELAATRLELQGALKSLESSSEEQKAINEEALSVNEEYQSTNEELVTSKEELQSLNEELTALNSQLQETLERQRTTANDLQNVLYSTDVATLFLDEAMKIRFFTPAMKDFFSILPGDLGRPLADLRSLANDADLLTDAMTVLRTLTPCSGEIVTPSGAWYVRRVLPYRTGKGVEGVVITFRDITDQRRAEAAMLAARTEAERANLAKSRFLAAASHDLRQPLQTLTLLQGLLGKLATEPRAAQLLGRIDETLGAMSGMLNTLLDINQIEVGNLQPEISGFPVSTLLDELHHEFSYIAQAKRLAFRVVPCGAMILSDPRLLQQMLRNLISNAIKYTERGKILIGCRHRGGLLSIDVGDTGIGIPEKDYQSIFEEYLQLGNAARERSRGLGLGLSIVMRLGDLLGHRVSVRSKPGAGSMFSIEVPLQETTGQEGPLAAPAGGADAAQAGAKLSRTILVVEDDPELRDLLAIFLRGEGHQTVTAADSADATAVIAAGQLRPHLILADFNLPNGPNGLEMAIALRATLHCEVPIIILTGDISTGTRQAIAAGDCVPLNKPVKLDLLAGVIQGLLAGAPNPQAPPRPAQATTICIVDDDPAVSGALRAVLENDGRVVAVYATGEAFLEARGADDAACLLLDAYLPGMTGVQLLQRLRQDGHQIPAIMITGSSDVGMAVQAMKAGALDFLEKPVGAAELLASVSLALELSRDAGKAAAWRASAIDHIRGLTDRQREIMGLVLAGHPSKNIAADLGISQRTIENHRASIMRKTGAKSLPALARLAVAANWTVAGMPAA